MLVGAVEQGDQRSPSTRTPHRFALVQQDGVPGLSSEAAHVKQWVRDKLNEHRQYITEHGEDLPEIRNWRWRRGA